MPPQSAKEQCFATAVETLQALKKQAGNPLGYAIDTQMPWTKNFAAGTRWQPVEAGPFKKWYYIYGYLKNKFGAGRWQVRYPDATVTYGDGSRQVYDCKFTRGDGSADVWTNRRGQYGGTQLEDYDQINREQGHPTLGAPELSRKSCQCDEKERKKELKPKEIEIPQFAPNPGLYFMPMPAPGGVPLPAPAPAAPPVPLRFPLPVPVW
jgi:hypothetical protein